MYIYTHRGGQSTIQLPCHSYKSRGLMGAWEQHGSYPTLNYPPEHGFYSRMSKKCAVHGTTSQRASGGEIEEREVYTRATEGNKGHGLRSYTRDVKLM